MTLMVSVVRGEFLKLRHRAMPWVLLGILIVMSQAIVWSGYFRYAALQRLAQTAPDAALQAPLLEQYVSFLLPNCLVWTYRVASSVGLILVAILTASIIGSEYGLATLRPMLIRGIGRTRYLVAKFVTVVLASGGALLLAGALAAVGSLIATTIAKPLPVGLASSAVAANASWSGAVAAWAVSWASLIPYIVLTATVTILARSAAVGTALSLGYYLLESVLAAMLTSFGSSGFADVAGYLLLRNTTALSGGGFVGVSATGAAGLSPPLTLALYTVVFAAITWAVFTRRDIQGPSGN